MVVLAVVLSVSWEARICLVDGLGLFQHPFISDLKISLLLAERPKPLPWRATFKGLNLSAFIDTGYCLIKKSTIHKLELHEDRIIISYAESSLWSKPIEDLSPVTLSELSELPVWASKDDLRIVKQLAI